MRSRICRSCRLPMLFSLLLLFALLGVLQVGVAMGAPLLFEAVDDYVSVNEDSWISVEVLANDNPGEEGSLSLSGISSSPFWGTCEVNSDRITYTPYGDYNGDDSFQYEVSDGLGNTTGATVYISVDSVNDLPVVVEDYVTTEEDTPQTVFVLANDTDIDDDDLVIDAAYADLPGADVTVAEDGKSLTYTPPANYSGGDSFTYSVSDGNGGYVPGWVSVDVLPVNDPPVAVDDVTSTDQFTVTISVLDNDSDADDDPLRVVSTGNGPSHGDVGISPDDLVVGYMPTPGYVGTDAFEYTVSDGNGGTDTATVTVTVLPVDTTPPALTVPENIIVQAEPGALSAVVTYSVSAVDAVSGECAVNSDNPSGSAFPVGVTTVNLSATDAAGNTANGSFTVTVNAYVPANNDFADAIPLTRTIGSLTGHSTWATRELDEPDVPGVPTGASIWYSFVPESSGEYVLSTVGSDFDTVLAVYTGSSVDSLTLVISNDDWASTRQSLVSFDVVGGTTYHVAVAGYLGAAGAVTLNWQQLMAAANNDFDAAEIISGASGSTIGSNVDATRESGEPDHFGYTHTTASIWYSLTPAGNGSVTVDTYGSDFDTILVVYSGSGYGDLAVVGQNDDAVGLQSSVTFDVVAGTTYHIAVAGYLHAEGIVHLNWIQQVTGDLVPPVVDATNLMLEATGSSGATATFVATAHDSVDGDITAIRYYRYYLTGSQEELFSGDTFPIGESLVTAVAEDASGNRGVDDFTVVVRDTTAPTLMLPVASEGTLSFDAENPLGARPTFVVTANDLVDESPQVVCLPGSGSLFPVGTRIVACTATDDYGNIARDSFYVEVVALDTTPPEVTAPNLTGEAVGPWGGLGYLWASALDETDGDVSSSIQFYTDYDTTAQMEVYNGGRFPLGVTTVTAEAQDSWGNLGTAEFTVTIRDTTAPQLTLPVVWGGVLIVDAEDSNGAHPRFNVSAFDLAGVRDLTVAPPSGSLFPVGMTSVDCTATDYSGNVATAFFYVQVLPPPLNAAPTVPDGQVITTSEDTTASYTLRGTDADGDSLTYHVLSQPDNGVLDTSALPVVTYEPPANWSGGAEFTYKVTDSNDADSNIATVRITVSAVNDAPTIDVSPAAQTRQYSDASAEIKVTASDVDGPALDITDLGLPDDICDGIHDKVTSPSGCIDMDCAHSGCVDVCAGSYVATFTASDGNLSASALHNLTVTPEDAAVDELVTPADPVLTGQNAVVGGTITQADDGSPGALTQAKVRITLVPIAQGTSVQATCSVGADGSFTHTFANVPINCYSVFATVIGDYFASPTVEDMLTVYDPTCGSATGGGWFYWPGTSVGDYRGDKTTFGFITSYGKKGTGVKGSLIVIRHTAEGGFRLKSNALTGFSVSQATDTDGPYGWATMTGKATFGPLGQDPMGNYVFSLYAEDRNEPGSGVDRFWLSLRKDGSTVQTMTMSATTAGTVPVDGGNIAIPHKAARRR